jgi:hypothetical protein
MEGLFEIVAAAFLRHGIESPAADSKPTSGHRFVSDPPTLPAMHDGSPAFASEPASPIAFPEHNYRRASQAGPASCEIIALPPLSN